MFGSCYPYEEFDFLWVYSPLIRCKAKTTLVIKLSLLSNTIYKVPGLNLYSLEWINLKSLWLSFEEFEGGKKRHVDFVENVITYYNWYLKLDLYRGSSNNIFINKMP